MPNSTNLVRPSRVTKNRDGFFILFIFLFRLFCQPPHCNESRKAANYSNQKYQPLVGTLTALIHSHYYKSIANNYTGTIQLYRSNTSIFCLNKSYQILYYQSFPRHHHSLSEHHFYIHFERTIQTKFSKKVLHTHRTQGSHNFV